jgi:mannitol/fructose-specific phosphotransferase system IIA component
MRSFWIRWWSVKRSSAPCSATASRCRTPGLLAQKTVVYTVLAPHGMQWGDETAHVIFLLAISKSEYEEAMAIYDIFVTFLRERDVAAL